jgi:transposase
MHQNFIECDREQAFLMPPSLRDWLPGDHLAWFVIETVEQLDLAAFYASYRPDGHGRAAYEPSMMVSLLVFAYSTNERSSRGIERHCRQDIAYRVITGNRVPDHATVHSASPTATGRVVLIGPEAVRESGSGRVWCGRDRWHEAVGERGQ